MNNFIKKETLAKVFSCEFCEFFKNIFLYRTPLVPASEFLAELAKNNCKENHFSEEISQKFLRNHLLVLAATFLKIIHFQFFSQFLPFFKHVRGVSRTHSNIKMEPLRKYETAPEVYSERSRTSKMELFV